MTQEEFIKVLDTENYSYEIEGDKIIVTEDGNVYLISLTSLPPGVEFKNRVSVHLEYLDSLPPGTEFRNGDGVHAPSLKSIPPGTEFRNGGSINLRSLTGDYFFHEWSGNIEGIDSKRLLNVMIKQGVFI